MHVKICKNFLFFSAGACMDLKIDNQLDKIKSKIESKIELKIK